MFHIYPSIHRLKTYYRGTSFFTCYNLEDGSSVTTKSVVIKSVGRFRIIYDQLVLDKPFSWKNLVHRDISFDHWATVHRATEPTTEPLKNI